MVTQVHQVTFREPERHEPVAKDDELPLQVAAYAKDEPGQTIKLGRDPGHIQRHADAVSIYRLVSLCPRLPKVPRGAVILVLMPFGNICCAAAATWRTSVIYLPSIASNLTAAKMIIAYLAQDISTTWMDRKYANVRRPSPYRDLRRSTIPRRPRHGI